MPIVSISKIQHRYGLSENLPQLAAAEFGWAIDQRRLFIGNGPTAEGAPAIGNTEILTQYSNLLEVAENSYSYKDLAVGYEAITGQSLSAPTTRSLQEKLDDFANVRDYGAKGNGLDDDTDAINRALFDLYTRDAGIAVRRVLYFPAGNYLVSDVIAIPPYATLQGEGKNCTIITATNSSVDCVARIADSKLQVGASVGANGATLPMYIAVNDLTFNAGNLSIDVFIIDATKYASFQRVGFDGGASTAPTVAGSQLTALQIFSTAVNHSKNIIFSECEFSGTNYAAILDDDMENIVLDKCVFKKLYQGLKVGESTIGSGSSVYGPRGLRITNNLFDEIYNSGIVTYQTVKITSAFNTYLDVGNQSVASPAHPVISFSANGCASICDVFARTYLENVTSPRISYNASKTIYIDPSTGLFVGKKQLESGSVVTLNDNISSTTTTGIAFTVSQKAQKINYIATRGTGVRSGTFEITATAAGASYSDTYTENGIDIGLTLSVLVSGSDVIVRYVTTSTGSNISFSYSVDRNLS
jgi:polygalacturonase